jgi:hypothetical protein
MNCIAQLDSDCEDYCVLSSGDVVWYNVTNILEKPVTSVPENAGSRFL